MLTAPGSEHRTLATAGEIRLRVSDGLYHCLRCPGYRRSSPDVRSTEPAHTASLLNGVASDDATYYATVSEPVDA